MYPRLIQFETRRLEVERELAAIRVARPPRRR